MFECLLNGLASIQYLSYYHVQATCKNKKYFVLMHKLQGKSCTNFRENTDTSLLQLVSIRFHALRNWYCDYGYPCLFGLFKPD